MTRQVAALAMLALAVAAVLTVVLSGTLGDELTVELGAAVDADARLTPDAPLDENTASRLALVPPNAALPRRPDQDRTQRPARAVVPVAAGRRAGAIRAGADGSAERSPRERVGDDDAPPGGDGPAADGPGGPPDGGSPGGGSGPPAGGGEPPPDDGGGGEAPPADDGHPGRGSDDAPGLSEDGPPGHSREGTAGHDRAGETEGENAHGS